MASGYDWTGLTVVQVYYPKFKDYKWTTSTFQIHPDHFPSTSREVVFPMTELLEYMMAFC